MKTTFGEITLLDYDDLDLDVQEEVDDECGIMICPDEHRDRFILEAVRPFLESKGASVHEVNVYIEKDDSWLPYAYITGSFRYKDERFYSGVSRWSCNTYGTKLRSFAPKPSEEKRLELKAILIEAANLAEKKFYAWCGDRGAVFKKYNIMFTADGHRVDTTYLAARKE